MNSRINRKSKAPILPAKPISCVASGSLHMRVFSIATFSRQECFNWNPFAVHEVCVREEVGNLRILCLRESVEGTSDMGQSFVSRVGLWCI